MKLPRIALVGCGAIARSYYAPALVKRASSLERLVFVDLDIEGAKELAATAPRADAVSSYKEIVGEVDGAIIALPHSLHHPVAIEFMRAGGHVLSEKPLAVTADQGREMVAVADEHGVVLVVNNTRRLFPNTRRVKDLIASGELGNLKRITLHEGAEFNWPARTNFYFAGAERPRGVLVDAGAHGVDLICWWLGEKPAVVTAENDSFGGPEATSLTRFKQGSVEGEVKLSWLTKLRNSYRIEGDRGTLEGESFDWRNLTLTKDGKRRRVRLESKVINYSEFGLQMVDNFIGVIRGEQQPIVTGADVLPSLEFLDECYDNARRLPMSWYEEWMVRR